MLSNHRVVATIPVVDTERAKAWYKDKLGLSPLLETEEGAFYRQGGGTAFLLYPTPRAGQAPNTLLGFVSTDIEGDVAALKQNGVEFQDYDMEELRTVNSIAEIGGQKTAWFTDTDGNILAISEAPEGAWD